MAREFLKVLGVAAAVACLVFPPPTSRAIQAQESAATVQVTINYGDGAERRYPEIPWREGMTVLDAMKAVENHPRGVKIEYRGSGATAFLVRIDDVENEGSGRNWIYRVNGELAKRSFAVHPLQRGDAVLWKFEKSR